MKAKTIIVDDELPICNEIAYLLEAHSSIEVVAKFDQSQAALDYLTKNPCDLVFLDINMPVMNGLEFAECVGSIGLKTVIIFVTAYEEYALSAFSTPALGYITKPVTQVKLSKVLSKVRPFLPDTTQPVMPAATVNRITGMKDGKLCPVSKSDIIMAYVKNRDVFIRTKEGDFSLSMNMQELNDILNSAPFLRVHRQYLINLDYVSELVPWFHGAYMLHMQGSPNEEIPIGRSHLNELKQALGFK